MSSTSRRPIIIAVILAAIAIVTWLAVPASDESEGVAGTDDAAAVAEGDAVLEGDAPAGEAAEEATLVELDAPTGSARTEEQAAGAGDETAPAQWIEGRAVLPPGTPADEQLFVIASHSALKARGLYDNPGIARAPWEDEERSESTELLSWDDEDEDGERAEYRDLIGFVPVENGAFRIAVPSDTERVHLALTGRYLHAPTTTPLDLPLTGDVALTATLGAWVSVRLVPPVGTDPDGALAEIRVELGPDVSGGFETMSAASVLSTRKGKTDAAGRIEFRAVATTMTRGLAAWPDEFAALLEQGIKLTPGEHRQLDVPLTRGATLAGRVLDDKGLPVAKARVAARYRGVLGDAFQALRTSRSDEEGRFELEHVASGKLNVVASHKRYVETKVPVPGELADDDEIRDFEVVLGRGLLIAGTVRFPGGAPAAGANVYASFDLSAMSPTDGLAIRQSQDGSAEADENGHFEVSGLVGRVFKVVAKHELESGDHEGTWRVSASGVEPGTSDLALVLEALETVTGRVTDLAGEPVAEFTVTAAREGSGAMFGIGQERYDREVEDEDGEFEIDELSPGAWKITVAAKGYAASEPVTLELPLPPEAAPLEFRLLPASAVAGVVVDPDGSPVAGARVTLAVGIAERMEAMQSGGLPETFTGVGGTFALDDLNPGELALVASLKGFASSDATHVDVGAGERHEGVELRLRVGGSLRGIVYDDDGEPAPGRMVMVQHTPTYDTQHMLQTDSAGEFGVENLVPGAWQVIATANLFTEDLATDEEGSAAMAELVGGMKMELVQIEDGVETFVELGAPPDDPVVVRGRVVHGDEPVEGATVTFSPEGVSALSGMKISFADANGEFEVTLEGPGPHLVTVQKTLSLGQQTNVEFLEEIPDGTDEHELLVTLSIGGLSGRVLGPDGKPLDDCRITVTVDDGVAYGSFLGGAYNEVTTDEEGRYEVPYLRAGTYSVAAGGLALGGMFGGEAKGGRVVRSGVKVDEDEWVDSVDFHLSEPCELLGLVVDSSGSPVKGAAVFIRDEEGRVLERFSLLSTDSAGRFTYGGVAAGSYTASAQSGELVGADSDPVSVKPGKVGELVVSIGEGATVVVIVSDESDEDVRAKVSVKDSEGREYSGMMSMASVAGSGRDFSSKEHRIGPVPPGRYTVTALADDGRTATKPVTLRAQKERKVRLRLK